MKRATIVLEDSVHKAAKIKAVMQDKTFIQYVADLVAEDVRKDLQTKKEQSRRSPNLSCLLSQLEISTSPTPMCIVAYFRGKVNFSKKGNN